MERVVVTGMGVISPVGNNLNEFWQALKAGESGIDYITQFNAEAFPTRIAGEVKEWRAEDFLPEEVIRGSSRFAHLALMAADEAVRDAGLLLISEERYQCGVSIGSSRGGLLALEEEFQVMQQAGPGAVTPELMTKYLPSSAASAVAAQTGARGPANTIVAACASGTLAIGQAYRVLQRGQAQVMIAGGAEAPLFPSFFAGTCALKAMSLRNEEPTKASRPFERDRDGFVMGEGAGIVILETLSHANFRRAKIYGEIIGYGATADAYHITAPEPAGEGIARAMELALREGKIRPDQVDYLNAHGTSTLLNDRCETSAIKKVFGSHAVGKASGGRGLAVSSTKSMTGHLLGAAGAIEFIVCLLAMQESIIPPTINYEHPEPGCDLDYVPNVARSGQVGLAMTNSLGFGGHNASLLVRKFECPAG